MIKTLFAISCLVVSSIAAAGPCFINLNETVIVDGNNIKTITTAKNYIKVSMMNDVFYVISGENEKDAEYKSMDIANRYAWCKNKNDGKNQ